VSMWGQLCGGKVIEGDQKHVEPHKIGLKTVIKTRVTIKVHVTVLGTQEVYGVACGDWGKSRVMVSRGDLMGERGGKDIDHGGKGG